MKKFNLLLFIVASTEFFACNSISDTLREKPSAPENTSVDKYIEEIKDVTNDDITINISKLEAAEKALRNLPEFKGKNIFVFRSIRFYKSNINIQIQNPENPDFVDEYKYSKGKWLPSTPVRLSKNDQVTKSVINLDEIPFKNAHNVYNTLMKKYSEIGSTPEDTWLNIYAYIDGKGDIRWSPNSIESDRYTYDIKYNNDGTLLSFEKR